MFFFQRRKPRCYFVVPVLRMPRLPLAPDAAALLGFLEKRAQVFAPGCTEVWLVEAATSHIVRLSDGVAISESQIKGIARRRPAILVNASFLLQDKPPYFELLKRADAGVAACADPSSDDAWAFAWSAALPAQRIREALRALLNTAPEAAGMVALLGCGAALIGPDIALRSQSPALDGIAPLLGRKEPDAPAYINVMLQEILETNQEPASTIAAAAIPAPQAARPGLLAARARSRVPWIFNGLLNALDYREGVPEPASFPPEMHLSLTGVCNLECRFCAYTNDNALYQYIDLERVRKLDFLRHVQVLRLSSGLGEPTLNKNLPAIIEYLTSTYPHLSLNFFTNAVALHRAGLIDALINKVKWINVSLNAASAQSWQVQHQGDQFDRVCANLQKLLAAKRARGAVFPLVFGSIVLNGRNLRDLPRMPALCRSLGIDRLTAFPYSALGYHTVEHTFGPEETLENFRAEYDALYEETVREAALHRVSLEIPAPSDQKSVRFGLEVRGFYDFARIEKNEWQLGKLADAWPAPQPPENYCGFLWRMACVGSTHKGSRAHGETNYLYPCIGPLSSAELSRNTAFRFPDEAGFAALWQNPVLRHLRAAQKQPGLSKVCDKCRNSDSRDAANFPDFEQLVAEFTSDMDAMLLQKPWPVIPIKAVESR
jgi:wyosine [tRNA(Phe)-imidazoG37] synthetase (radical SAM superfamily)